MKTNIHIHFFSGGTIHLWQGYFAKSLISRFFVSLPGRGASFGIMSCLTAWFLVLSNNFFSTTSCCKRDPLTCHMWTTISFYFAMCWNFSWSDWNQFFPLCPWYLLLFGLFVQESEFYRNSINYIDSKYNLELRCFHVQTTSFESANVLWMKCRHLKRLKEHQFLGQVWNNNIGNCDQKSEKC